jgi:hypothetical protein
MPSLWGRSHDERDEADLIQARLTAYQNALHRILELADGHDDDHEALLQIGDLAETALKL